MKKNDLRWLRDHKWRWDKLYKIRAEDGIIRIKQKPEQLLLSNTLYEAYHGRKREEIIVLKSRQIGLSTWASLFCLDTSAYYPGRVSNTIADTDKQAKKIFKNIARLAYRGIPPPLRPYANTDNVGELYFEKLESKYIVSATKSEPVDVLHISESPYFQDEERIKEALQMRRKISITIEESTAFGVGNGFEQRFTAAWTAQEAGKPYHRKAFFFPWFTDPKNVVEVREGVELLHPDTVLPLAEKYDLTPQQQLFYDQQIEDLDEEVFQFYPSEPREAFLSSGRPVFNLRQIQSLQDQHARSGTENEGWTFYREVDSDCSIGVDPAEGLATGDNTAAKVLNKQGQEVATIAGKYDPEQIAEKLDWMCRLIGSKGFENYVVVERNNHGHAVVNECKNYTSIRLYRTEAVDAVTQKKVMQYGWNTNAKTKSVAITELRKALKNGDVVLHDYETYAELMFYMYGDRGTMNAMIGKHDDRIISTALANMGLIQWVSAGSLDPSDYGLY